MKKIIAIMFAAVLGCGMLALVGCGGGGGGQTADSSGHWTVSGMETGGETVSMSDLESYGVTGDDIMSIDLNADGSAKINVGSLVASFMGESSGLGDLQTLLDSADLKWEATASGVNLTFMGQSLPLEAQSDGTLAIDQDGTKMFFSR